MVIIMIKIRVMVNRIMRNLGSVDYKIVSIFLSHSSPELIELDHHCYCDDQDINHYDHVYDHYNDDTDDARKR